MSRKGEDDTTRFRSARVECINGQWFFSVREAPKPIGPFPSKKDAQIQAASYAKDIAEGRQPLNVMSDLNVNQRFTVD